MRRFIPACAGNTHTKWFLSYQITVHPRLCGEHNGFPGFTRRMSGSSPPVRGTRNPRQESRHRARFIPACAGNTSINGPCPVSHTVHPRLCGEHSDRRAIRRPTVGSSPPVRGTLARRARTAARDRFIPACAGNTRRPLRSRKNSSVHPRLCGEHLLANPDHRLSPGSSPPVRGTQRHERRPGCGLRFIPACAGNTA